MQERRIVERHEAFLPSVAEHEHIRGDRIAEQGGCDAGCVDKVDVFPGGLAYRPFDALRVERKIGIMSKIAGEIFRRVHDNSSLVLAHGGEHLLRAGDDEIAAEHQISFAGGDPDRVNIIRSRADLDMAVDGAALLRQAGHVDRAAALAFEMRRHAQNGAYGDDAGAAHPGHENPTRLGADCPDKRPRQAGEILLLFDLGLPWPGAMHRNQGWAETIEAGKILVAARLVDHPLAAELGFKRLDRNAIGFRPAIAAAFAHKLIDNHATVGVWHLSLLAAAAFFRRASLIVNKHGYAGSSGELA